MRKRDLINMAMDALGHDAVDYDTAEITANEKKLGRQYDVAAIYVLHQAEWIEAVTNTTLTSEASGTNVFDDFWEYMYDLPSDCLKVLDIDLYDRAPYIVQGSKIYTNYYNASTGFNLRYLKDIREETNNSLAYSDMLAYAIAARLTYEMSPLDQKGAFRELANDALLEAMKTNEEKERWSFGYDSRWWTDVDRQGDSY